MTSQTCLIATPRRHHAPFFGFCEVIAAYRGLFAPPLLFLLLVIFKKKENISVLVFVHKALLARQRYPNETFSSNTHCLASLGGRALSFGLGTVNHCGLFPLLQSYLAVVMLSTLSRCFLDRGPALLPILVFQVKTTAMQRGFKIVKLFSYNIPGAAASDDGSRWVKLSAEDIQVIPSCQESTRYRSHA